MRGKKEIILCFIANNDSAYNIILAMKGTLSNYKEI